MIVQRRAARAGPRMPSRTHANLMRKWKGGDDETCQAKDRFEGEERKGEDSGSKAGKILVFVKEGSGIY